MKRQGGRLVQGLLARIVDILVPILLYQTMHYGELISSSCEVSGSFLSPCDL